MKTGRKKDEIFGETAMGYLRLVAAERMGSWHAVSASSMQWGTDNESAAIDEYRKRSDAEVNSEPFQFFELNDHVGGTPDALVADAGCLEIKCPFNPSQHVETLVTRMVPAKYVWQCVGHMLVTGRQWCDFVSFDPRIPETDNRRMCVIRLAREESRIEELNLRLDEAIERVELILRMTNNCSVKVGK